MPPDHSESPVWQIIRPDALTWRCWDGDYVIFNALSGMTHTLDVTAGTVFELALQGPATADELRARLAAFLGQEAPAPLTGAVDETLARLDQLGLAETVA
jgi:PqqD family protein of HPr-rel-A system